MSTAFSPFLRSQLKKEEVERAESPTALFMSKTGKKQKRALSPLSSKRDRETNKQRELPPHPIELPSPRGVTRCQHCGSARVAV